MLRVLVVKPLLSRAEVSVFKTLTGVTLSWKTELDRSISTVEDGIPGWLQHCHKTCCEKGGRHGRWACMIWRWFHHGDVISRQVDLHMTHHYLGLQSSRLLAQHYYQSL